MKLHLKRSNIINSMSGMACTNNPYTKGRILNKEDFKEAIWRKKEVCKKCKIKFENK